MVAPLRNSRSVALPEQLIARGGSIAAMATGWSDMIAGLASWRLWVRMGWNDILQRYRRSVLGPFWLTASTAIMVVVLGLLYAELFKTQISDFLPFLCTGLLVWNLLATFLGEGGMIFTAAESYIKQVRLPYSI